MTECLPDVEFKVAKGKTDYMQCDGCHAIGKVTIISMPKTLYYDGKNLTTRYREYWLCSDCKRKLREAVEWG